MSKTHSMKHNAENHKEITHIPNEITPFDLRLVTKKIKIKFSSYKISNTVKNMMQSESIAISNKGVLFPSDSYYEKGTLMRVWIEIPDYWSRKSKHVEFRHSEAPTHFQILSRVIQCEEQNQSSAPYQVLCENLNIDSIDESVLQDYLISSAGANRK